MRYIVCYFIPWEGYYIEFFDSLEAAIEYRDKYYPDREKDVDDSIILAQVIEGQK